jgi:hypothetical protein
MPISTAITSVELNHLGNLPRLSDTPHGRRARFHQAWFRAEVLGVREWGTTPAGRSLGSILPPAAAAAGANFTSDSARELFTTRRQQGWGVDPGRMTSHLTSSQTLLVNLLGPLFGDMDWLTRVLRVTLERPDISHVVEAQVEFAPAARSRYLGDMTRMDAFFKVRSTADVEGVVLELKYIDRFSTRKLPLTENALYIELAETTNLWHTPVVALSDEATSQLLRCHALGARTLQVDHGAKLPTTVLLVSHPLDPIAKSVIDQYRNHLRDPSQAIHLTLDKFLSAAAAESPDANVQAGVRELELRYLDHSHSEGLWREHLLATSRRDADADHRSR